MSESTQTIRQYLNSIRPMTKGESDLVNVCLMLLAEIELLKQPARCALPIAGPITCTVDVNADHAEVGT